MQGFLAQISGGKDLEAGSAVSFNCIIREFTAAKTRNGKDYASLMVSNASGSIGCKIWDAALVSRWRDEDIKNKPVRCTGALAEYNGALEVHISGIEPLAEGRYDVSELVRTANTKALVEEFLMWFNTLPQEWQKVVSLVFGCVEDGFQRFYVEYAAQKYHDAQRSGLLNHTVKMLRILDVLLRNDPRLEDLRSLLTAGIIIHDVGKLEEMHNGVYAKDAYINHRMRGVMYLAKCEKDIIGLVGEDNYNRLLSIVHEHHGGFGAEPMHTVYAMLVFMVDNCDAQFTNAADILSGVTEPAVCGENRGMRSNDTFLVI